MADAKVLIVDDEVEFGRVLSERMEARGLSADTAESGMEAIEMIGKRSYDAVILDLMIHESLLLLVREVVRTVEFRRQLSAGELKRGFIERRSRRAGVGSDRPAASKPHA